ncbi:hypothetical protein VTL71DRAFT_6961 [Oculimacula yallundae]|uniref:Uncharacterized protein n=1 Tax=Oculimacula yallundae TaxID=86028 RepID=A0ABR4BVD0_9HELO
MVKFTLKQESIPVESSSATVSVIALWDSSRTSSHSMLSHPIWDTILNACSLILAVIMAGFTISSCRNSWPFILLAIWKLMFGFMQPVAVIISAWVVSERNSEFSPLFAGSIYAISVPIGYVGIFHIAHDEIPSNYTFVLSPMYWSDLPPWCYSSSLT